MSGAINQSLIPKYYMCYTMYRVGQSLYAEIYYSFSQTTLGFLEASNKHLTQTVKVPKFNIHSLLS